MSKKRNAWKWRKPAVREGETRAALELFATDQNYIEKIRGITDGKRIRRFHKHQASVQDVRERGGSGDWDSLSSRVG